MSQALKAWPQYALSVILVATAVLLSFVLRVGLQPATPGQISSPLLLLAVAISAWQGGNGPGLVAAFLSLVGLEFIFSPPTYAMDINWNDLPRIIVFIGTSLLVSRLTVKRRQAETALHRTDEKLKAARIIQERLYPLSVPTLPGIDLAGASLPANSVGGDYFDYIPLRSGAMGVVVGDVSGHGLGPALLMAETRAYLRGLAITHDDIGEILTHLNRVLVQDTEEEFVTLFLAAIDPQSRRFTYAGAGHEAYLLDGESKVQRLRSTGLPLGLEKDSVFRCAPTLTLTPGQVILMCTDGVSETHSRQGSLFGIERSLEVVRAQRDKPARQILDSLIGELRGFADWQPQEDDITAVILKT